MNNLIRDIEELVGEDAGCRGLGTSIQMGDLEKAAESLYTSNKVFIVTGFCIKDLCIGETDGPIGAASLANSLLQLGKDIILITDEYSEGLLKACCRVLKMDIPIMVVPFEGAEAYCSKLIEVHLPSHVVAVERPGRALDGKCYSMRGEDITDFVPNTDPLFIEAKNKGIVTIAVGDGGNEMGMGKIKEIIETKVNIGDKISAVTIADYLIVAGVSNWGGHGLSAAFSLLASKMLLHDAKEEEEMLKAMVEVGAVDGCSKKCECTVDGLSLEVNLEIVRRLREIVLAGIGELKIEVS